MDGRHPEHQYLDLLRDLLESGSPRIDRTGVGTRAKFGASMRFDLSDGTVPIFTTKKVLWEVAAKETLWFLSGSENIRPLLQQGVRIWSAWPHKRYVEETGSECTLEEFERLIVEDEEFANRFGNTGRAYGAQWRQWKTADGRKIDQVANCLDLLRNDPYSRRILFHAWNVGEVDGMILSPCHLLYQLGVEDGRLNMLMFQRSADIFIGVPFNLWSSALLLRMFAQQVGLGPGILQWFGGDVHLYENHVEAARVQLSREPRPWPKLHIRRRPDSIDGYVIGDFAVEGYDPHGFLKAPVAV